jgi:hypothetical protein
VLECSNAAFIDVYSSGAMILCKKAFEESIILEVLIEQWHLGNFVSFFWLYLESFQLCEYFQDSNGCPSKRWLVLLQLFNSFLEGLLNRLSFLLLDEKKNALKKKGNLKYWLAIEAPFFYLKINIFTDEMCKTAFQSNFVTSSKSRASAL